MHLFVMTLFLVFGWSYIGMALSKEKKAIAADDALFEKYKLDRQIFSEKVEDREMYKSLSKRYDSDPSFKSALIKEYVEVLCELQADNIDINKLATNEFAKKLAPAVHMAKSGKLPQADWSYPVVFLYYVQEKDVAPLYKWFDKTINNIYPEYYMLRYRDDSNARYRITWNPYILYNSKEQEKIADIPANMIYKPYSIN